MQRIAKLYSQKVVHRKEVAVVVVVGQEKALHSKLLAGRTLIGRAVVRRSEQLELLGESKRNQQQKELNQK